MNRTLFHRIAGLALVLVSCLAIDSQSFAAEVWNVRSLPVISTAEREMLDAARAGNASDLDLIDAALTSSGVLDRAARERWLRVRDARYSALDLHGIVRLPLDHRPAAILAGLHREILAGKFRPMATLMHETLASGDYNCVTATILYHDLCLRCGVSAEIVAQSGHVHSRITGTPSEDVETTRRDWFTRETSTAPQLKSPSASRVISPTQLLGRVYYNRALAALERKQFAAAIDLLRLSLALDEHDRDARENLLAGLNNWALALCEAGEHAAAADKIAAGLSIDSHYQPLRVNELHVHQQWVSALCERAEYAQAVALLEAGRSRRPEAAIFSAGQKPVFEAWLRDCATRGDAATAAEVLRQAKQHLGDVQLTLKARPREK